MKILAVHKLFPVVSKGTSKTVILMPLLLRRSCGGISDGESILFTAIITDKAGNATTGTQSGTSIAFDQSVPAFSSLSPSSNSSVKVADVGYTLSETIASGTVTYTRTGGTADGSSPHKSLSSGARSLAALSNAPTLVSGTTYEIDFNGVDAAGNAATEVSVTGIFLILRFLLILLWDLSSLQEVRLQLENGIALILVLMSQYHCPMTLLFSAPM